MDIITYIIYIYIIYIIYHDVDTCDIIPMQNLRPGDSNGGRRCLRIQWWIEEINEIPLKMVWKLRNDTFMVRKNEIVSNFVQLFIPEW